MIANNRVALLSYHNAFFNNGLPRIWRHRLRQQGQFILITFRELYRCILGESGAMSEKHLYVSGLENRLTSEQLHAAFIPYGDLEDVHVPIDKSTGLNKGFGFVTFELAEDAADALDNLHNAELFGKRIRVQMARSVQRHAPGKAIWAAGANAVEE